MHLCSSAEWVVRCWGGLLLVFCCWCVLFFCLVSWVEFLWLLGCGWFVALRSLVGRCCCTVTLFSLCVVGCFFVSVVFCSTYFESIIVSCVIFVLPSCVVILSVPVVNRHRQDNDTRVQCTNKCLRSMELIYIL